MYSFVLTAQRSCTHLYFNMNAVDVSLSAQVNTFLCVLLLARARVCVQGGDKVGGGDYQSSSSLVFVYFALNNVCRFRSWNSI